MTQPVVVPEILIEADQDAATASSVYDVTCRELQAARDAMIEANRAYVAANEAWVAAGTESALAQNRVTLLRQFANVVMTADGYRTA